MFRLLLPAALLILLACAPLPDTGYVLAFGQTSGGHAVTYRDGTSGFAYWCTAQTLCLDRAQSACADRFTIRNTADIDPMRSPDALRRDSSSRNFFENTRTGLGILAVSC